MFIRKDGTVVYPVLERELTARKIKRVDIARHFGFPRRNMSKRLNGELNFSLHEAIIMHEKWFPDIPIEVLFSKME